MSTSSSSSQYYIVSLVFAIVAAAFVFLDDFAGWLEIGDYDYYAWIGAPYAPILLQAVLVLIGLGFIGICYFSFLGMSNKITSSQAQSAFLLSVITLVLVVLAAIIFAIFADFAEDWWFETSFYTSLIGSLITTFFLYQAKKSQPLL